MKHLKKLFFPFLIIFLFIIVDLILIFLSNVILKVDLSFTDFSSIYSILVINIKSIIAAILAFVLMYRHQLKRWYKMNVGTLNSIKRRDVFTGILFPFIGITITIISLKLFSQIELNQAFPKLSDLLLLGLVCVLVSIKEEILCRGYVLRELMKSYSNKYIPLFICSFGFMALHCFNPNLSILGIINLFLAGLVLGISYVYTKNLIYPIFLHFSWNFSQMFYGFNVSGLKMPTSFFKIDYISSNDFLTGGEFGLEGGLIGIILNLILIYISYVLYHKNRRVKIISDDLKIPNISFDQ
ncbi:CPBP family intramembrane metalloprotease [Flammeovirga sp. MY04]|uniref:CPBP family intramembrane glutamic endopeptidase n=1 Tax=Flammeovirga sp. MY04 TaxID=1191459 RepID=UPI000806410B|nr:type II CAAX endopeptidase family protein [Flammeovirga sp. MY04]ANQ50924.1 CPBP family intramembrane metalloprotease [Flammeovirga sp. MY04]